MSLLGYAGPSGIADYSSLLGANPTSVMGAADGLMAPSAIEVLGQGSLVPGAGDVLGGIQAGGYGGVPGMSMGGGGIPALGIANAALGGLQALGSLWMANKQMKLAKKQFKFTKDITNINLNNQMQSYNTALADRARSRGVMEGQDQSQVQSYIDSNSLSKAQAKAGSYSLGGISSAALGNYSSALASGKVGGGAAAANSSSSSSATEDKDG